MCKEPGGGVWESTTVSPHNLFSESALHKTTFTDPLSSGSPHWILPFLIKSLPWPLGFSSIISCHFPAARATSVHRDIIKELICREKRIQQQSSQKSPSSLCKLHITISKLSISWVFHKPDMSFDTDTKLEFQPIYLTQNSWYPFIFYTHNQNEPCKWINSWELDVFTSRNKNGCQLLLQK